MELIRDFDVNAFRHLDLEIFPLVVLGTVRGLSKTMPDKESECSLATAIRIFYTMLEHTSFLS